MGVALTDLGRIDEAIAAYGKALEQKPDYAEAFNNIGVVLASRGRAREAAEQFRKALAIRPDYADARKNYQRALGNLR
jgi:tetratricopeptide (TPR) repeat protein